jgi:hypothetical protein
LPATKLWIFDIQLGVTGIGSEGYEKPRKAHAAKTKDIPARENIVYFDSFVNGDNVRSENVEISPLPRPTEVEPSFQAFVCVVLVVRAP